MAELMAAEVAAIRNPGGLEGRPGWLEGILATLRWAWSGSMKPPLEVPVNKYRLSSSGMQARR